MAILFTTINSPSAIDTVQKNPDRMIIITLAARLCGRAATEVGIRILEDAPRP